MDAALLPQDRAQAHRAAAERARRLAVELQAEAEALRERTEALRAQVEERRRRLALDGDPHGDRGDD